MRFGSGRPDRTPGRNRLLGRAGRGRGVAIGRGGCACRLVTPCRTVCPSAGPEQIGEAAAVAGPGGRDQPDDPDRNQCHRNRVLPCDLERFPGDVAIVVAEQGLCQPGRAELLLQFVDRVADPILGVLEDALVVKSGATMLGKEKATE